MDLFRQSMYFSITGQTVPSQEQLKSSRIVTSFPYPDILPPSVSVDCPAESVIWMHVPPNVTFTAMSSVNLPPEKPTVARWAVVVDTGGAEPVVHDTENIGDLDDPSSGLYQVLESCVWFTSTRLAIMTCSSSSTDTPVNRVNLTDIPYPRYRVYLALAATQVTSQDVGQDFLAYTLGISPSEWANS